MSHWGITTDISCLLCDDGIDDINHIMITCPYTCAVQQLLFGRNSLANSWEEEIDEAARKLAGDSPAAGKLRLYWRACASSIWYERCRRNAGGKARPPEELHAYIVFESSCIL
ncbi:hypothetical protein LINPERHAP1_LOCUS22669 [Linum perenne]